MRRDGKESYLFSMTFDFFLALPAFLFSLLLASISLWSWVHSQTHIKNFMYFLRRGFLELFSFFRDRDGNLFMLKAQARAPSTEEVNGSHRITMQITHNFFRHWIPLIRVRILYHIHKNGVGKLFDNFHFVKEARGRSWALELVISSSHKK